VLGEMVVFWFRILLSCSLGIISYANLDWVLSSIGELKTVDGAELIDCEPPLV
jgi:hypothetical protein